MAQPTTLNQTINAIVLLAFGIPFTVYGWLSGGYAKASLEWPKTTAIVVEPQYSYGIAYAYTVDGVEYTNSKYSYGFTSTDESELHLHYDFGEEITVYYDPSSPGRSVMRPYADALSVYGVVAFGGALALLGLYSGYRAVKLKNAAAVEQTR